MHAAVLVLVHVHVHVLVCLCACACVRVRVLVLLHAHAHAAVLVLVLALSYQRGLKSSLLRVHLFRLVPIVASREDFVCFALISVRGPINAS
jgi:hypothetical protein